MNLRKILALGGICALASFSSVTRADSITEIFQLTSDHCSGGGGCIATDGASAGTVQVTDNGTGTLVFVVTLNNAQFVDTGFQADFGFNLVDTITSITYSAISSGWAPVGGNPQAAGSLHMDGTGDFDFGLNCTTGCPGGGASNPYFSNQITFTIAASGLTINSLQLGNAGNYFAVDVLGNGNTGGIDASSGTVCTPPICNPQIVPEPATLALIGIALLGMGVPALRRGM